MISIIASILLGLWLRLAMFLSTKSFWFDEWASIEFSSGSLRNTIVQNLIDTHPPLYFLILHSSIKLFGFNEIAFRLPSLLAGVGVLLGVYVLALELFDKKTAILSLFFIGVSPYFIHLSSEIRNHGLPIFFVVWATYFFLKYLKSATSLKKWAAGYTLCALGALYTDHFTWFWLLGIFVFYFIENKIDGFSKKTFWPIITLIIFCLPALGLLLFQTAKQEEFIFYVYAENYTSFALIKRIVVVYWHFIIGPLFNVSWTKLVLEHLRTSPLFWASLILFIFYTALIFKAMQKLWAENKNKFIFFSLTLFLPTLVVGILSPYRLETRYFSFAAVFFLILGAWQLSRLENKWTKSVAIFLIANILIFSDLKIISSSIDPLHTENYVAMTQAVCQKATSKDVIRTIPIFEYYLKQFNLEPKATLLSDPNLNCQNLKPFDRLWYLEGGRVDASDFYIIENRMKACGFRVQGQEIRFGGPIDFVAVNLYERS